MTLASRAHALQRSQSSVDRAERVDLEHQPAHLAGLLPRRPGHEHAGVVDPDLERSGALGRGRRDLVARLLVAHVKRRRERAASELRRGLRRCIGVEIGDVDRVAPAGEQSRDLQPQAPFGTGDNRAAAT